MSLNKANVDKIEWKFAKKVFLFPPPPPAKFINKRLEYGLVSFHPTFILSNASQINDYCHTILMKSVLNLITKKITFESFGGEGKTEKSRKKFCGSHIMDKK